MRFFREKEARKGWRWTALPGVVGFRQSLLDCQSFRQYHPIKGVRIPHSRGFVTYPQSLMNCNYCTQIHYCTVRQYHGFLVPAIDQSANRHR